MIHKPLLTKIFDAANMQRWNDQIRPVELKELDKQAHKMIIAFILGKFEEERNKTFSWIEVIEGGIFEFLQRIVVTDLKPQLFHAIKEDKTKYRLLNDWVYAQIKEVIAPLGKSFCQRFHGYLRDDNEVNINRRILSAAHFYATKWEFDIIERANPSGYEIKEIKSQIQQKQEKYYDLKGIQQLALYANLKDFVDLCGQLRFQIRWSHLHRVPKTSVLGHMLIVAILSYLFSLQIGACRRRCINNFFTGLFHDLPEVLTKDVINPIKRSVKGIESLIKKYERQQMRQRVYKLIPPSWHMQMRMFTENEFQSLIFIKGKPKAVNSETINNKHNRDKYNPKDGELVKAADHLAAFLEAYLALENGITNDDLKSAKKHLLQMYKNKVICGIKFGDIYKEFS